MDHTYPDEFFKRASHSIKLNEHFLQYRQLLSKTNMQEKICFTLKIDEDTYKELENSCR